MPADLLVKYWGIILLGLFAVTIAFWAWQEREPEEAWADTTRKVGDRTSNAVGGTIGLIVALAFAIGGVIQQAGISLSEIALATFDFIGANPEFSAGIGTSIIGWLTLNGTLSLTPRLYAGVSMVLLGLGMLLAVHRSGGWSRY